MMCNMVVHKRRNEIVTMVVARLVSYHGVHAGRSARSLHIQAGVARHASRVLSCSTNLQVRCQQLAALQKLVFRALKKAHMQASPAKTPTQTRALDQRASATQGPRTSSLILMHRKPARKVLAVCNEQSCGMCANLPSTFPCQGLNIH